MTRENYWTKRGRITRRKFFGGAAVGGAGLAGMAMVGCGNDDDDDGNGNGDGNGDGNGADPTATAGNGGNGDTPERGGTLRVGNLEMRGEFDPNLSTSSVDWGVNFAIYDTLLRATIEGEIVEGLATNWEMNDNQLILTLREGVKFHDGGDFTAESVVRNVERTLELEGGSRVYSQWSPTENIEATDERTVTITLAQPRFGPFMADLATIAGAMPSPDAVEELGDDFRSQPVGTGPYRVDSVVLDSSVDTVAFEDYWGAPDEGPLLDNILWNIYASDASRVTAMQAGELEILWPTIPIAATFVDQLAPLDSISIMEQTSSSFEEVRINRGKFPFENPDLLKAFGFALDREAMVSALHAGNAVPAGGPLNPNTWAFDSDFVGFNVSAEEREAKVQEHLDAAGYPDGFEMVLDYNGSDTLVQELIAEQVAQYGIVAELQAIPPGEAGTWLYDGEFMALPSWTPQYSPDPDSIFRPQYHSNGQFNYHRFSVAELDELIDEAALETDQEARTELYHQIQEMVHEEGNPRPPRVHPIMRIPMQNNVQGVYFPDNWPRFNRVYLES